MRLAVGALVLVVLVARLGAGPFLDGLRLTSAWALVAATAVTALTTICCAWRWQLVAAGLGVRLRGWDSVAAVYRAQFLNATLPGGVLGDVDRAVVHARATGVVGPGVRSVAWERALGQVVQVVLTMGVLLVVPSPLRAVGRTWAAFGVVALAAAGLGLLALRRSQRLPARAIRTTAADLRGILATRRARLAIAAASALAASGHVVVFLLAAHVAGVPASTTDLLPLAAVVLLAAAVPANVAGWGPREGVAAWVFGAAGLGTSTGVTTAVVYGVLALVSTLPGAVVLLAGRRSRSQHRSHRTVLATPVLEEAFGG